ncbi:MAG: glycosyltransferase family 1 protein [Lachnospiraceae bacterium]|nr:glycosyltransferase family 1 protein [Lachnospiraceae bacterium]
MYRILHELANLDGGGVARLLYDYYSYMDKEVVHFDFVISDDIDNGILENPLRKLGCTIYKIPSLRKNFKERMRMLDSIISGGNYDAVHSHIPKRSCFIFSVAKKYGVSRRIAHSHIAYEDIGKAKEAVDRCFLMRTKMLATDLLACGEDAARYMWGKKVFQNHDYHIMRNAINTEKFRFSEEKRNRVRAQMGLSDKKVLGIVGRLDEQKNHKFLLKIAKELCTHSAEYVLLVIGRGPLEQELRKQASQLNIEDNVRFLGIRDDVDFLLNALDVFILPSLYEGLPVVLVEAQANGLPVVASDSITKEMAVTDLISFLPLTASASEWARAVINAVERESDRKSCAEKIKDAGYDIAVESKKMQEFYIR